MEEPKTILAILLFITASCSNPSSPQSQRILNKAETIVKTNLKAPDSYELKNASVFSVWRNGKEKNMLKDSAVMLSSYPTDSKRESIIQQIQQQREGELKAKGMLFSGYRVYIVYSAVNPFNARLQSTMCVEFDSALNKIDSYEL